MPAKTPPAATGQTASPHRRVLLANPRGFCAGVQRAVDAVEQALLRHGAPVFVRHAIVHNQQVVERLERLGAVFVQEVGEIPEGAIAILSAHGSARAVKRAAQLRKLRLVDAICPLVAKVHVELEGWHRASRHVLLIGHKGHPEIVGSLGQLAPGAITVISSAEDVALLVLPENLPVAYAVQTTFAAREAEGIISKIKARFRDCAGPRTSDICYATTNRQKAVEAIAAQCELMIVVGDKTSSNANRLVEVARSAGCSSTLLLARPDELPRGHIDGVSAIGLTAAASTPAEAVEAFCSMLRSKGFHVFEAPGFEENVRFKPISLDALEPAPS